MADYHQMHAERNRSNRLKKRRRQLGVSFFILVIVILLALSLSYISYLKSRLREAEKAFHQLDTSKTDPLKEALWDKSTEQTEEKHENGNSPISMVESIEEVETGKPVRRTKQEVLLRLEELGGDNPLIKEISENSFLYPDDLLKALANNPEMAQFAAGYPDGVDGQAKGISDVEKETAFPLFLQWDLRWGYEEYGDNSMVGVAGCGPTCLSMVLFSLTRDESLTPDAIAKYSMENGYYVQGTGTAWALMEDVCWRYGVRGRKAEISETEIKYVLDRGGAAICSMAPGDFTDTGHFVVIYGYDQEGFWINDPNCVSRSRKKWSWQVLKGQIKSVWTYTL